MTATDYDAFIASKQATVKPSGFEPLEFTAPLFDWQRHVVSWALRLGRAALFEDCGLGKTAQQLEWATQVAEFTQGPVIILTPLCVAQQTQREAFKFGIPATVVADASEITGAGVYITNYEKLDKFDGVEFSGVVLDESSILKNFTGVTRRKLTARFNTTPYRLACTATPSPNDYTELGQHADFLGICSPAQMLATYFINDTFNTGDWRLKKHAEKPFWTWVASWAACIMKPSDIGFSDEGYDLPPLNVQYHILEVDHTKGAGEGELLRHSTLSATTMHQDLRLTLTDRVAKVAELVNTSSEQWLVWCNTDDEGEMLAESIQDGIEISGSDSVTAKEAAAEAFISGHLRCLISKPKIFGMGMNFQHCRNMAFVGLTYSMEQLYQALRREYRFGQQKQVNAHIVQAATETRLVDAIETKMKQHAEMAQAMRESSQLLASGSTVEMKTTVDTFTGSGWTVHNGDCVRVARTIPDASIGLSVFSPPFADLFTYSNDAQDMGNSDDLKSFMVHFGILVKELARVMIPGREVCVHCVDLLSTKWKTGRIELQDFSGEIIREFWKHGFLFHSRITIWKSPVTEMQRTKAHGLLYKTLRTDSSACRVGVPDYMLIFRTPGESAQPVTKDPSKYPVDWWQEVASPVWMTVDQGNVLNRDGARDQNDERHICPLQMDVITRCVEMWSNPGDLVYSPFTGIGSEGVGALKLGRKFVGSELKLSYAKQACLNLENATNQLEMQLIA